MALRKIHNVYYVYFRDVDGRLKTRSLKTADPVFAKAAHDDYMKQLQAKKTRSVLARDFPDFALSVQSDTDLPPAGIHLHGGIKIADMFDCAAKKRVLGKSHAEAWSRFSKHIGVKYADQVTPSLALAYLTKYYSKGNGKTFNNQKSMLNTIFRCCLIEAGLNDSPFRPIVNKRVTRIASHRNLTLEEFDCIMQHASPLIQVMSMLSRWTAQRLETCARMTISMFDWKRRVIVIQPGKTRRFGKWVCCPIMPELDAFLKHAIQKFNIKSEQIPIVQQIGYVSNNAFSVSFTRLLSQLNIKSNESGIASFHSLRGTAITWYQEHGIKGEDLRHITGHVSSAVEDVYARDIASVSAIAKRFSCM